LNTTFSVLMSIYKDETPSNLRQCLESLEAQTLKATDVVLVEDGVIDAVLQSTIEEFRHSLNIKSVRLAQNIGLAAALNKGLESCDHAFVARMDTDDVCLPERFEKQIGFLMAHPEIAVVGALVEEYDVTMSVASGIRHTPSQHVDIMAFAKRRSPLSHPTVVFRKEAVLAVGGYPLFRKAQDYALWSLMLQRGYTLHNVPEVLLNMRAGAGMMERRKADHLKYELAILKYQKSIGFLTPSEYLFNVCARSITRLSPSFVRTLIYKFAR